MVKRMVFTMFFGMILACTGLVGQVHASETVGSFDWKLTGGTNMQSQPVEFSRPILSLDVDMGMSFLNLYGTLCSENGVDCTPVVGSGYFYNGWSGVEIRIGLRAGTKEYRIVIHDLETLEGALAIYDRDGNMEAGGSVVLQQTY